MDKRYFSEKVVEWYLEHKRDLPWRNTVDPYKIWLSEIILQQTRVIQGLPYYLKFIKAFPDVFSLAAAPEQEILRLWQGLGYYTRARNLHKCAQEVVTACQGKFPQRFLELINLPGIGEYTAAAVASFSAREKVAVVDGNVFRVLSRIFGEPIPINSPQGKKVFSDLANKLIPESRPDLYNQAIMEFGALWCTPTQPKCENCPFSENCFAAKNELQHELPVKLKGKKSRKRYFHYFVIKKGKSLLMKQRKHKDIWHGLYDFYLVETPTAGQSEKIIRKDPFLKQFSFAKSPITSEGYKHVLSHQTIIAKFVLLEEENRNLAMEDTLKYYPNKKINDLPKPVLISRFLKDYNFL
jgi:A/G-specific adenine glycosylase